MPLSPRCYARPFSGGTKQSVPPPQTVKRVTAIWVVQQPVALSQWVLVRLSSARQALLCNRALACYAMRPQQHPITLRNTPTPPRRSPL